MNFFVLPTIQIATWSVCAKMAISSNLRSSDDITSLLTVVHRSDFHGHIFTNIALVYQLRDMN